MNNKLGTLYGVSVGTGDPELITIKGLKLLQDSKVVAFPAGIGDRIGVAQNIIRQWLKPSQITLPLSFPYTQDRNILEAAWIKSAQTIWEYLKQGQDIAFACEGDISFYSTFTHLATTLKQLYPDCPVKTIPGVCSPVAAASDLGLPLTVEHQRLTVLPALYATEQLETALDTAEVVILLKISSVYRKVWEILKQRNLLDCSFVIERASSSDRIIHRNLSQSPNLQLPYFTIAVIYCNPLKQFDL